MKEEKTTGKAPKAAASKPKRVTKAAPDAAEVVKTIAKKVAVTEVKETKSAVRKKSPARKAVDAVVKTAPASAKVEKKVVEEKFQEPVIPIKQNELPFEDKHPVVAKNTTPSGPVIKVPKIVDVPESYSSEKDIEPEPAPAKPAESTANLTADNSSKAAQGASVAASVPLPKERAADSHEDRTHHKPHPPRPPYGGGEYKKDYPKKPFPKPGKYGGKPPYGGGYDGGPGGGGYQGKGGYGGPPPRGNFKPIDKGPKKPGKYGRPDTEDTIQIGTLQDFEPFQNFDLLCEEAEAATGGGDPVDLNKIIALGLPELLVEARKHEVEWDGAPSRQFIFEELCYQLYDAQRPLMVEGILEMHEDGYGIIVYTQDNYKIRPLSTFLAEPLIKRFGLKRGHAIRAQVHPPREGESCPFVVKIESVMGREPESIREITPFEELTPYYPTVRMLLETGPEVKWDNFSMRIVDLLTPIGRGQRGLIVAPPRTGKTVLQQGIANAVVANNPDIHLIVLLVDERPEEVTDFRRQMTKGEVIASTFDQNAESHVHCAEMVLEKARRLVETGQHVCILLDSITRLARAYNTLAANSGKILSGGVEASALQKPKRFFGSARNIEGAGSLTIIGTALVETGSRMDEVIFEEFKGTGNSELHLDRGLSDKRIFPSIAMERSGTRKEELLYHPDEMLKIYALRRAMKGVPPVDAMEMLIARVKKTRSNAEFLMGLNR